MEAPLGVLVWMTHILLVFVPHLCLRHLQGCSSFVREKLPDQHLRPHRSGMDRCGSTMQDSPADDPHSAGLFRPHGTLTCLGDASKSKNDQNKTKHTKTRCCFQSVWQYGRALQNF